MLHVHKFNSYNYIELRPSKQKQYHTKLILVTMFQYRKAHRYNIQCLDIATNVSPASLWPKVTQKLVTTYNAWSRHLQYGMNCFRQHCARACPMCASPDCPISKRSFWIAFTTMWTQQGPVCSVSGKCNWGGWMSGHGTNKLSQHYKAPIRNALT